jgi:hypothetical protein
MRATVEDLRKGDVVLISTGQGIFDVKLLRQPQLAKVGKKTTWGGKPRWTSVLCAMRIDTITQHYTNYNGKVHTYVMKRKVLSNGRDYNEEKRVDFSEKECWIIKREEL